MLRQIVFVLGVLIVSVALSGCWTAMGYGDKVWRYKITIAVQTPEGLKTGSSIREISGNLQPPILTGRHLVTHSARGEAVVVDLGKRGLIFAPLIGRYGDNRIVADTFPNNCERMQAKKEAACVINFYTAGKQTAPKKLDEWDYPLFVNFADINDPKTIQRVLDMKPCPRSKQWSTYEKLCIEKDYFEEFYGAGVYLESVTIEMTKEPLVYKIINYLPWLNTLGSKTFHGEEYHLKSPENSLANQMRRSAFIN